MMFQSGFLYSAVYMLWASGTATENIMVNHRSITYANYCGEDYHR